MQNEYCNGGNLEEHIIKNNGMLQEKDLTILLEHMAEGLRYEIKFFVNDILV